MLVVVWIKAMQLPLSLQRQISELKEQVRQEQIARVTHENALHSLWLEVMSLKRAWADREEARGCGEQVVGGVGEKTTPGSAMSSPFMC